MAAWACFRCFECSYSRRDVQLQSLRFKSNNLWKESISFFCSCAVNPTLKSLTGELPSLSSEGMLAYIISLRCPFRSLCHLIFENRDPYHKYPVESIWRIHPTTSIFCFAANTRIPILTSQQSSHSPPTSSIDNNKPSFNTINVATITFTVILRFIHKFIYYDR